MQAKVPYIPMSEYMGFTALFDKWGSRIKGKNFFYDVVNFYDFVHTIICGIL